MGGGGRTTIFILVLVLACVTGGQSAPSRASHVDPPPSSVPQGFIAGALVNPHIVNLYWDANWDADIRDARLSEATLGQSAIDRFVKALTEGSYFHGLQEYGVQSVEFEGGFLVAAECGAKAPPSIPRGALGKLVTCMEKAGKLPGPVTSVIVNFLLPPITTSIPSEYFAYHGFRCCPPRTPIPFTVVPVHSALISTSHPAANSFGAMLSHEIVEAITNPFNKYGWRGPGSEEEIADFCQWRSASSTTPVMPFLQWSVTRYWSNQRNACVFD